MRTAWLIQGAGFLILLWGIYTIATRSEMPVQEKTPNTQTTMENTHMLVRSPAFGHEQSIPSKYTCDGDNISPPLAIDNIPNDTVSLVLIMDDPDAPNGTWDHWIVFNMPPNNMRIGEGDQPQGTAGTGTAGTTAYQGPCPPDGEHRYLFKVYALDTSLRLDEGASKAAVEDAMQGHILERNTLMGRYTRITS